MKYTSSNQDRSFRSLLIDQLNLDQQYDWILEWIAEEFNPDDIFDNERLNEWAIENGYIKEEK